MYIITDGKVFLGKDFKNKAIVISDKKRATEFSSEFAARNFIKNLPVLLKKAWYIKNDDGFCTEIEYESQFEFEKVTPMEDKDFDICGFFEQVIDVMSNIDLFINNMAEKESVTDMKILDIRHYIRNNNHKLNAIQMQRLGYYLQELEKERYSYKSNRLIASMFSNNLSALKDKSNISKMREVVSSQYKPRVLDDNDIECIINKKKDIVSIA